MENMNQLSTEWGKNLDREAILQEYPRPTLRRDSYMNLNGEWDYAISEKDDFPNEYDGKILVPFSPETLLSGVERQLQPEEYLYYRRMIDLTEEFCGGINQKKGHLLLHFGAVDQECLIYVNHNFAGAHVGGYLPFTLNITRYVSLGENEIQVVVKDKTDESFHSRGKQKLEAGGMFYTAQSGIWQTVWMEYVPDLYIRELKIQPMYDEKKLRIKIFTNEKKKKKSIEVQEIKTVDIRILKDGELIQRDTGFVNQYFELDFPEFESWTPENPVLYQIEMELLEDKVESYFAMRKVSVDMDNAGIQRFYLNNELYFQNGVLDQGYWPEGLYTAPSDEAMISDITRMKELGFNMLRKHVKIEPERWYYHCDRLGMLVWQDMVNGGGKYKMTYVCRIPNLFPMMRTQKDNNYGMLARKDEEGQKEYIKELRDTVRFLYNHPCIVTWVPFNEGWGQFEADAITKLLRKMDPARLIDQASGWFDQGGGDYYSIHNYFKKLKVKPQNRVVALTEYAGYSCLLPEHSIDSIDKTKIYGYKKFDNTWEMTDAMELLVEEQILPAISEGLCVAVFTQLSDIEEEVNGLLTYDRARVKPDEERVKRWNRRIFEVFENPDILDVEEEAEDEDSVVSAEKPSDDEAQNSGQEVETADTSEDKKESEEDSDTEEEEPEEDSETEEEDSEEEYEEEPEEEYEMEIEEGPVNEIAEAITERITEDADITAVVEELVESVSDKVLSEEELED